MIEKTARGESKSEERVFNRVKNTGNGPNAFTAHEDKEDTQLAYIY